MKNVNLAENRIVNVEHIFRNVASDFVKIEVQGLGTDVTMSVPQFVATLVKCHHTSNENLNLKSKEALKIFKRLRGGKISGVVSVIAEGEEYEVTENSRVMQADHEMYGQFSVGDKLKATRDSARPAIGEWLFIEENEAYRLVDAQASVFEDILRETQGLVGGSSAPAIVTTNENNEPVNEGKPIEPKELTVEKLRDELRSLDVEFSSTDKKAVLVDKLMAAQA